MTCDYSTAKSEMFGLLLTAWQANAQSVMALPAGVDAYTPYIQWPGVVPADDSLIAPDKYWARVSTQVVTEGDAGIGADEEGNKRRYSAAGLIFVQCFGPMAGDPLVTKNLDKLAQLARNAFRGQKTASGVWFRNAQIQPLNPDGKFQRNNAKAEFQYDEIG